MIDKSLVMDLFAVFIGARCLHVWDCNLQSYAYKYMIVLFVIIAYCLVLFPVIQKLSCLSTIE